MDHYNREYKRIREAGLGRWTTTTENTRGSERQASVDGPLQQGQGIQEDQRGRPR